MIFGINTTSVISKLFYIISRAVGRVTILKYHKWYLCQISRTIHAIVYTTTWEIQSSNAICLFLSSCFASSASKLVLKFLFSAQLVQTLSQVDVLSSVFWFYEFSFSSWISWFQNLEIFPPFLRNSCDEIIWWFWVTIVTVIFTCRYFKLSWNTSALGQSNGRNFSGSSISGVIPWVTLLLILFPLVFAIRWIDGIDESQETDVHYR